MQMYYKNDTNELLSNHLELSYKPFVGIYSRTRPKTEIPVEYPDRAGMAKTEIPD